MSNSESSLVRPTEPGSPWAPPQPLTEGSDPTVPSAPELNPVPEEPSDRVRPVDPTMPMPLTDADSLLSVAAPEGMVRITLGAETKFCFPCHIDGWQALGWQAHPPSLPPADGGDEVPPNPPAALAVIERTRKGPFLIGVARPGQRAVLIGTNFEPGSTVVVKPPVAATVEDLVVESSTKIHFDLDTAGVAAPVDLLLAVTNSSGMGPWFTVPLEDHSQPDLAPVLPAAPDQVVPEFAAMTKAQIVAEVEASYGVLLDTGMTKAELVAEAERLAAGGRAAAAPIAELDGPTAESEEPSLPLDLLG